MFQVVETENYVQNKQAAGLMLFPLIAGSILQPNVGLCLGDQSANPIQCIHRFKTNALRPGEPNCPKVYKQVKLNAAYAAECLLIGEYSYLQACFAAIPHIPLCPLCRYRVPSAPRQQAALGGHNTGVLLDPNHSQPDHSSVRSTLQRFQTRRA